MRSSVILVIAACACIAPGAAHAAPDPAASAEPLATGSAPPADPPPVDPAPAADRAMRTTFTNTLRYDAAVRLRAPSQALIGQRYELNENDGDRAFGAGQIIDDRANILSELDLESEHYGARISGSAWYDAAYAGHNDIPKGTTVNWQSVPASNFPLATTNVDGRDAQLLDAFVFAKGNLGPIKASARLGQHALLWGETLFFGGNGVAGGMAPIDAIQALSYPAAEFKEIVLPTNQFSTQLQLTSDLAIGGYYQLHWRGDRIPGAGSYFSDTDVYNLGGERLLIGPVTIPTAHGPVMFSNAYLARAGDLFPGNNGQFGGEIRYRPPGTGLDLGGYFVEFDEKAGTPYLYPGKGVSPPAFGQYAFAYPQHIRIFALSASKSIGDFNVAAEASVRGNQDLLSNAPALTVASGPTAGQPLNCNGKPVPVLVANNSTNPCYAIGDTLHANGSMFWTLPGSVISKEGSLVAELAWMHLIGVTANPSLLDPYASKNASALALVYTPTYRRIFKRTDLDVPISYRVGLQGTGAVAQVLPSGGSGNLSAGLRATYDESTVFTISYTHFVGPTGAFNDSQNYVTGLQSYSDRDFLSASISRSF